MPARLARLPELERVCFQVRLEGALALVGRRLAIELGARHLRGRQTSSRAWRWRRGAFEGGAVFSSKGGA